MKFTLIVFISCVATILPVVKATKVSRRLTLANDKNDKNGERASQYLHMLEEVGSMPSIVQEVEEKVSSSSCPSWGDFSNQIPAVGRTTIQITDKSRDDRTIAVDIWYPAEDNGEQLTNYKAGQISIPSSIMKGVYFALDNAKVLPPQNEGYPLLIFSMGARSIPHQSARLMEHLASWGFVVCSPDHPGNSFDDPSSRNIPFSVQDRPKDISFAIDNMLSPEYVDRFHLQHAVDRGVGVLGHSYGGTTSLLVAPDAHSEWSDDRVKAIMPISPAAKGTDEEIQSAGVDWGEGMSSDLLQRSLPNVVTPTMVIGGQNDVSTPVDRQNFAVFDKTNGIPRFNAVVPDAGHTSFADICPLFDRFSSLLGEGMAYRLIGGGNYKVGKSRVNASFCDTNDEVQATLGYYAVAFFSAMLLLEDDERDHAFQCMNEQSASSLSTYEFLSV